MVQESYSTGVHADHTARSLAANNPAISWTGSIYELRNASTCCANLSLAKCASNCHHPPAHPHCVTVRRGVEVSTQQDRSWLQRYWTAGAVAATNRGWRLLLLLQLHLALLHVLNLPHQLRYLHMPQQPERAQDQVSNKCCASSQTTPGARVLLL